jgi:hypothetical protein
MCPYPKGDIFPELWQRQAAHSSGVIEILIRQRGTCDRVDPRNSVIARRQIQLEHPGVGPR